MQPIRDPLLSLDPNQGGRQAVSASDYGQGHKVFKPCFWPLELSSITLTVLRRTETRAAIRPGSGSHPKVNLLTLGPKQDLLTVLCILLSKVRRYLAL